MTAQAGALTPDDDATAGTADDSAIIHQSRLEPEHFAVLFRRHAPALQRYVTRRLGAGAADDVVAETFLTAFRQRGGYDLDRADARPWLYGIATHLIGRHRRSEIRQYRILARTGHDPVAEPFTDRVDAAVSAAGVSEALATALARLPRGHRDVLLLVAWGELSYPQVAEALGVPVGTVRSRLSRARTRIRRALGDADPSALADGPVPAPGPPQASGPQSPRDETARLRLIPAEESGAAAPPGGGTHS